MKKWILPLSVLLVLLAVGLGVYLLLPTKTEYCGLAFGPEARLRILVRLQSNRLLGPRLFFDRWGTGDFVAPSAFNHRGRRCYAVHDPDQQTTYTITGITRFDDHSPPYLCVDAHVKGPLEYSQYCGVELTSSPKNANEAHFHGPLTVELTPKAPWTLKRGNEPTYLRVNTGTIDPQKGCWVVVRTQRAKNSAFPAGVYPVAHVEFPARDNGPPIERRYPLDEPC